jgi:hypothetical protein
MSNMRVEKDCAEKIPLKRRPYGYVYICCTGINDRQTYFGEVQVISNYTPVYFRYTVDYLDMVKRYYRLTLFKDREFERVISKVHVEFVNDDSRRIKLSREVVATFVPDEIFNLMHMVIYERIIQQLVPQIQLMKLNASPEKVRNGVYRTHGFKSNIPEDFFEETYVKFEDFVSTLKLILEE